MGYVFAAAPQAVVPVAGSTDLFPVHRIYCVGRNYEEHAKEMGFSGREPPFFFMKPADAVMPVPEGAIGELPYPPETSNLHHEMELVVAIGRRGARIAAANAKEHVFGYAVGLDMTRRDRQAEAKKLARPWEIGKAFDQSCPITPIVPAARIGHPAKGAIRLKVNGTIRQEGDLAQQIWSVPETIAHLSRLVTLAPGDLIMTGTPAGVGAVQPGDRLEGHVDGVGDLTISYAAREARAAA